MKKKVIFILLIVVAVIVGISFNNKKDIPKMIKEAEILDLDKVRSIVSDNGAKKEDYEGKMYIYTGEVSSIEEDYCSLGDNNKIDVYLDTEILKSLKKGDKITVIGKLYNIDSLPELDNAVKLDNKTIKDNFIMAVTETYRNYKKSETNSNYKVDSKTHLITSYKTSGDSNGIHKLKYDRNGNIIEDKKENSLYGDEITTYTYNSDNLVVKEVCNKTKDGVTELISTWEYTYEKDSKNRVIKKTGTNVAADDKYTMVYNYEYDKGGKVIKEIQTSQKNTYEIEYKYDDLGNKISEFSVNVNKPSSKAIITHKYSIIAKK